ncbi:hypothetical protein HS088_TW16G00161 [Tripterygium wilfordii]|uniref:Uncharacterized protein n=1 Tax=Tripterygium wilfordii TaxID=458696 RepID=A0A7J7CI58_TRIWF|nr:uncharacterized protein LOC119980515 [Tripterygium wilfordii]KAF5733721.1 hypothetical protein HS088_TW16G00161 [Tripterygium wilfordii]
MNMSESHESEIQGSLGDAIERKNDYGTWAQDHIEMQNECRDDNGSSREQSHDLGDVERERVGQIVRGWMESDIGEDTSNVSHRNGSPRAEWLGETEHERVSIVREWVQMTSQQRGSCGGQRVDQAAVVHRQPDHVREGSLTDQDEGQPSTFIETC